MICQNLFSWKNKKNIINLLSSEIAKRVVKVKLVTLSGIKKTTPTKIALFSSCHLKLGLSTRR